MNSASAAQTKNSTKAPSAKHASGDKRFKMLDATIKRYQYQQDALIEVLHKAQELFGYLENDVLLYVAHSLKLPPSRVYGVATFYHLFSLAPSGVHTCVVCTGTACYVKGSQAILTELEKSDNIHAGETTADGQVSLLTARCLGACGIAPAVVFDGKVLGNQTAESVCEWLRHCFAERI
jgi:bidirectional [NiFe] hydrogenase diaphorase subunit